MNMNMNWEFALYIGIACLVFLVAYAIYEGLFGDKDEWRQL